MTGASNYEQGRLARIADFGRVGGATETAFRNGQSEVDRLHEAKRAISERKVSVEVKLAKINASIDRAQLNRQTTGGFVPRKTWLKWQEQKASLICELNELRQQESDIRLKLSSIAGTVRTLGRETFERAFFNCAKQMLADDVFERILTAAHHRAGDDT